MGQPHLFAETEAKLPELTRARRQTQCRASVHFDRAKNLYEDRRHRRASSPAVHAAWAVFPDIATKRNPCINGTNHTSRRVASHAGDEVDYGAITADQRIRERPGALPAVQKHSRGDRLPAFVLPHRTPHFRNHGHQSSHAHHRLGGNNRTVHEASSRGRCLYQAGFDRRCTLGSWQRHWRFSHSI